MRLLDTETGQFVDFADTAGVRYAILSHTWDPRGEQTYQEIQEIRETFRPKARHRRAVLMSPSLTSPTEQSLLIEDPEAVEEGFASLVAREPSIMRMRNESTLSFAWRSTCDLLIHFLTQMLLFLQRFGVRRASSAISLRTLSPKSATFVAIWDDPRVSDKIRQACAVACADGYRYIWIDSCCIDKTSSSELSEAINSMYLWYQNAAVCYAFLEDVPADEDPHALDSRFRESRWFTRGWTLQELIAPEVVVFLSKEWRVLGSKSSLATVVEEVTGIDLPILTQQRHLDEVSVARRMSWASRRRTTRLEDQAYALLGIFDINMPTLYGEGHRAFIRLQEEILKRIPDQSLFAWGEAYLEPLPFGGTDDPGEISESKSPRFSCRTPEHSFFASSPEAFHGARDIRPISHDVFQRRLGRSQLPLAEYSPSPYGIRTHLPLLAMARCFPFGSINFHGAAGARWSLAILACEHTHCEGKLLARVCLAQSSQSNSELLQGGICVVSDTGNPLKFPHLFTVSRDQLELMRGHLRLKTVYIAAPLKRGSEASMIAPPSATDDDIRVDVTLSKWSIAVLRTQGYSAVFRKPTAVLPNTYTLILSKGGDTLSIECRCLPTHPSTMEVRVDAWARFRTGRDSLRGLPAGGAGGGEVVPASPAREAGGVGSHHASDPYHWFLWDRHCKIQEFALRKATGEVVTVRLSLELVSESKPCCHLRIEVMDQK